MAKKVKVPVVIDEIKRVKRKIQYHDLIMKFDENFKAEGQEDQFLGFFSIISKMTSDKAAARYVPVQDARICLQDLKFIGIEKKITGKMFYVKNDVFPELIDTVTDITTDIEAAENAGVVETTHFIIDYSRATKKIGFEYNHAGAKIADFMTYCKVIGELKAATTSVDYKLVTKDELKKYKNRMRGFSSLTIRVHKDNIESVEKLDDELYTSLKNIQDLYKTEYVEIKMKFKYKKIANQQKIKSNVDNLLNGLVNDKVNLELFDVLKVSALDKDNNLKMTLFDLLVDRVESEVYVERKPKHKVIVSVDMFEKIKTEMLNKHI